LKDPCHGLNLPLKHSLKELPSKMIQFVESITNYFAYPQRKAALKKKIQNDNNLPIKFPKQIAATRWLSLGECLARLIDIWESLVKYFDKYKNQRVPKKKKNNNTLNPLKTKMPSKEINELLNDEIFYLKINFLSYIVNIINKYNKCFQNQHMDICGLKSYIHECFHSLLDIVANPTTFLNNKKEIFEKDWQDTLIQEQFFMSSEEFIENIIEEFGSKYKALKDQSVEVQKEWADIFHSFVGRIINLLIDYLPLKDPLVEILDFVDLKDDYPVLREKVRKFNKKFNIIEEKNLVKSKEELIKLNNTNIEFVRNKSNSHLHLWDHL